MGFKVCVLFMLFHLCYADSSSYSKTNRSTTIITNINATNVDGHLQVTSLDTILPINNSTAATSSNTTQLPLYDAVKSINETSDKDVKVNDTNQQEDVKVASTDKVNLTLMTDRANGEETVKEGPLPKNIEKFVLEVNKNSQHIKDSSNYSETNKSTSIININATNVDGYLKFAALDTILPINNSTSRLSNTTQLTLYKDDVKSINETSNEDVKVNDTKRQEDVKAASSEKVNLTLLKDRANGVECLRDGPSHENSKKLDLEVNRSTINIEVTTEEIQKNHAKEKNSPNHINKETTTTTSSPTEQTPSEAGLVEPPKDFTIPRFRQKPIKQLTRHSTTTESTEANNGKTKDDDITTEEVTTKKYTRYRISSSRFNGYDRNLSQQRRNSSLKENTIQTSSTENNNSSTDSIMSSSTAPTLNIFKSKRKEAFINRRPGSPHFNINRNKKITSHQSIDNKTISTEISHSNSSSQQLGQVMNGETTTEASYTRSSLRYRNNMRSYSTTKFDNSNIYAASRFRRVKLKNSTNNNNDTNSGTLQVSSIQEHLQNTSQTLSQKKNNITDTVSETTSPNQAPLINLQNNQLSPKAVTPNSTEVNDKQPKTVTNITIENENKPYRSRLRLRFGQQSLNFRKHVNDKEEVKDEENRSRFKFVRPRVKKIENVSEDSNTTKAVTPEEESTTKNSFKTRRVYKRPSSGVTEKDYSSKHKYVRPRPKKVENESEASDTTEAVTPEEESTTKSSFKSRRVYKRPSSEVTGKDYSSKHKYVRPRGKKMKNESKNSDTTEAVTPEEESTTMNSVNRSRVYKKPASEITEEVYSSKHRYGRLHAEKLKYQSEDYDKTEADIPEGESTTMNSFKSRRVYKKPSSVVTEEDYSSKHKYVRPRPKKVENEYEDTDTTEADMPEEESTTMNSIKRRPVYKRPIYGVTEGKNLSKYMHARPRVGKLKQKSEDLDAAGGDVPEEESTTKNILKTRRVYEKPSSESVNSKSSVESAKDFDRKGISESGKNFSVNMEANEAQGITLDLLSDYDESSVVNMRRSRQNQKHDGLFKVNTVKGRHPVSATHTVKALRKEGYSSIPADIDHKNAEKENGEDLTKETSVTGISDSDLTQMQEYIDKRNNDGEVAEQSKVTIDPISTAGEVEATNTTDNLSEEDLITVAVETATDVIDDNSSYETDETFNGTETIIEDDMDEMHQNNTTDKSVDDTESHDSITDYKDQFNLDTLLTTTESSTIESSTNKYSTSESSTTESSTSKSSTSESSTTESSTTESSTTASSTTTVQADIEKSNILILVKDEDRFKDQKTDDSSIMTTVLEHPINVSIRIQTENKTNYIPLDVKVSEDVNFLMLNFTWPTNENITNTISLNMKKTSTQYVIDTIHLYLVKEGNMSTWTKNITQTQVIEAADSLHLELGNGVHVMFSNTDFLNGANKGTSAEDSSKKKEGTVLYVEIIVGSILIACLLIIFIFAGYKTLQLRRERRDHASIRH